MKKSGRTYDIVAGIPSFNNQKTIAHVSSQICKTFEKYYKKKNCLIVDCDGGSTDDTIKNFLNSDAATLKRVLTTPVNVTGKGNVFKLFFQLVKKYKADVAIVNDSDLRSINTAWVRRQIRAIEKGYDFAAPYYSRYKYDATITNHVCYPLIYGLFCRDIRQPIGGDFAFSNNLAGYWLKRKWPVNAKLFGIDIFMTTNAILGGYRVCQVNLKSKVHDAKDPGTSLSPMFRQVVSTLFKTIISNSEKLGNCKKVEEVPILGPKSIQKPQEFDIDAEILKRRFIRGVLKRKKKLKQIFSEEDYMKLRHCVHYNKVSIPVGWWVKLVYDLITAYKKNMKKSHSVMSCVVPLWFGRVYTFVQETKNMTTEQAEKLIKKQAREFFKQRGYLLDKL